MNATVIITMAVTLDGDARDPAVVEEIRAAVAPIVEHVQHRVTARGVAVGDVRVSALGGDDALAAIARAMGAT